MLLIGLDLDKLHDYLVLEKLFFLVFFSPLFFPAGCMMIRHAYTPHSVPSKVVAVSAMFSHRQTDAHSVTCHIILLVT